MSLQGKGFFTTNLSECEGGDPIAILAAAQTAGLSHIFVKIADGVQAIGLDASGNDSSAPVVQVLRKAGIATWGWHVVYGHNPSKEAAIALTRIQALDLDGYVVCAGAKYQHPGTSNAARQFMAAVRAALKIPIALSSYRFPNFHPEFPWSTFLEFCDLHMPQVTWELAHNTSAQLFESRRQCDSLPNARAYIPTGAAYSLPGWSPTPEDVQDFLNAAKTLRLTAVNFFDWDTCRGKLPLVWKTIAGFAWPTLSHDSLPAQIPFLPPETSLITSPEVFIQRYMQALNGHDSAQVAALYDPDATQVWADQIRHGAVTIQSAFSDFFASLPAGTDFSLSDTHVEDDLHVFTWKAAAVTGETTLTLKDGKIVLDYTFIF